MVCRKTGVRGRVFNFPNYSLPAPSEKILVETLMPNLDRKGNQMKKQTIENYAENLAEKTVEKIAEENFSTVADKEEMRHFLLHVIKPQLKLELLQIYQIGQTANLEKELSEKMLTTFRDITDGYSEIYFRDLEIQGYPLTQ